MDPSRPLVIAHRGASATAPENTIVAFEKAIEAGAEMIEMDVRLTQDGQAVVIHDSLLHRTAQSRGRVEARTYEQLKTLDVGAWLDARFSGQRIPRLEEVLEMAAGRIGLNIELKCRRSLPAARDLVVEVARMLPAWKDRLPLIVSSFHRPAIDAFRHMQPTIPAWYIYSRQNSRPAAAHFSGERPTAIVESSLATPSLVEMMRKMNGRVLVWTVDDKVRMHQLMDMGVDGIMSNRPDVLRTVRDLWVVGHDVATLS